MLEMKRGTVSAASAWLAAVGCDAAAAGASASARGCSPTVGGKDVGPAEGEGADVVDVG
jgi:hypothetical protein